MTRPPVPGDGLPEPPTIRGSTKLVVADVDGTLLTHDKVLTPRAVNAVRALRRAGVRFALTSSRPPRGLAMLVEPLELDLPLAAFNGGVYARPDLSVVESLAMDPPTVENVIRCMESLDLEVWAFTADDWFVRRTDTPHALREQRTVHFSPTVVAGFAGRTNGVIKVVAVSDDSHALSHCAKLLEQQHSPHVSAVRSQEYYLDLTHPDANKGRVVKWMCNLLGITPEQVAVIGDMSNDIPMFQSGAFSIAMGQASEAVRKHADVVTASSEEEGFSQAMERYVLGEGRRSF